VTADGRDQPRRKPGRDEMYAAAEHLAKFAWHPGDVEITPGDWQVAYAGPVGSSGTFLVQDLDGLVQHLEQQPGYDGDLQAALDYFAATDLIRHAPMKLIAEIISSSGPGLRRPLPRTITPGRALGDGTARHGYGPPVFDRDGYACVYCGLDMLASYQAWLQLSVDHVIPQHMIKRHGYRKDWIEDLANLVTCCRSCNEFGNRFQFDDAAPASPSEFFDLRDRVFVQRRARLSLAHALERLNYEKLRAHTNQPDGIGERV
jgi:HNH endonuclease